MKRFVAALAGCLFAANASACPELDVFVKRYGISFSGFEKPIPAVSGPGVERSRLLRLPVANSLLVSDGFQHTVLYHTETRRAWILRTGGFVGVREWYGPVDAGDAKLQNCRRKNGLQELKEGVLVVELGPPG